MLYKAYRQNEKNEVTEINEDDLKAVITYTDNAIMTAGGFGLEEDFAYNFLPQYENGKESIWAVQYSQDDNTMYGNLNFGNELTAPQFFGCCDFQKPSQNLVNAFRTETVGRCSILTMRKIIMMCKATTIPVYSTRWRFRDFLISIM